MPLLQAYDAVDHTAITVCTQSTVVLDTTVLFSAAQFDHLGAGSTAVRCQGRGEGGGGDAAPN